MNETKIQNMTISIDEKDEEVKKVPQQPLLPDKIIDINQDQEAVIKSSRQNPA